MSKCSPFHVWWVVQQKAISATDPKQPGDDSKPKRMYVVVADPKHSSKVACCPIQTNHSGRIMMTEVELTSGSYGFITTNCKIIAHEIYTLPEAYFADKVGQLNEKDVNRLKLALKTYFRF